MTFRELSPAFKLATWGLLIFGSLTVIQVAMLLLGFRTTVLENGTPLLVAAITSLLLLMSLDRRPIAEYGIVIGPDWHRSCLRGLTFGVTAFAAWMGICVLTGALTVATSQVTVATTVLAVLGGMTGIPLAGSQQAIFSGYLVSMLRQRWASVTAVLVSSALFAVLNRVEDLQSLREPRMQLLVSSLFLFASIMAILRLLTGSILTSTGILAGWLAASRFSHKLSLFLPGSDAMWRAWLIPYGDPRQSPVMVVGLGVLLVMTAIRLWRVGEAQQTSVSNGVSVEFRRVFPFSHAGMLIPLDIWLRQIAAARFRIGLKYLPRMLVTLSVSTCNTILTLPERLITRLLIRGYSGPPPVFILGTHRSGTTHLHTLMSQDPQFCAPQLWQAVNPAGALITGRILIPLLAAITPWKRPMDAVRVHVLAPQEEEFLLMGQSGMSPYWGMTFPRRWPACDRYIFPNSLTQKERETWKNHYLRVIGVLTFWRRKTPLLKSPHNTGRAALLAEMFPGAKFIHLCRNPDDVYRSNIRLAQEAHVLMQLQDPDADCCYESRFPDNYRAMEEECLLASQQVQSDCWSRLKFEDLERNPVEELHRIYDELGLEWSEQFDRCLSQYVSEISGYKKNPPAPLDPISQRRVNETMGRFKTLWGYTEPEQTLRKAA